MVSSLLLSVTLVSASQSWNAEYPIVVTELGIVTRFRLLQLLNASLPILVTELGIVMLASL